MPPYISGMQQPSQLLLIRSLRRQRLATLGLAGAMVAQWLIGASAPPSDAEFNVITCRALKVLDSDGVVRVGVATSPKGDSVIMLSDAARRPRMAFGTLIDGTAVFREMGTDGKPRLVAQTLADGATSLTLSAGNQIPRLDARIDAEGNPQLRLMDRMGTTRIGADASRGVGAIMWFDAFGKSRMTASTIDRTACMWWQDENEQRRITIGTEPGGKVLLPNADQRGK